MQALNLTAIQADLRWEDPIGNQEHLLQMLQTHPSCDVLILPEMFTTGFSMAARKLAEPMNGQGVAWMQKLARQYDCLVMGSLIIEENAQYYNRMIAMTPEGVLGHYDKRHTFRMAGEHKHYSSGSERVIFTWRGWRICPQICYDLRFPVWSRCLSGAEGPDYDLLIYSANWPKPRVRHWECLLQARAIENQAFVVGVNRVGEDGAGIAYSGSSMILDPLGDRLAYETEREAVLHASLDPDQIRDLRRKFPVWQDADSFQIDSTIPSDLFHK